LTRLPADAARDRREAIRIFIAMSLMSFGASFYEGFYGFSIGRPGGIAMLLANMRSAFGQDSVAFCFAGLGTLFSVLAFRTCRQPS
jgi:hypothetical protein